MPFIPEQRRSSYTDQEIRGHNSKRQEVEIGLVVSFFSARWLRPETGWRIQQLRR